MLLKVPTWAWTAATAFLLTMFILVIISFARINKVNKDLEYANQRLAWDEQTVSVFLSQTMGLSNTTHIKPAIGSLTQPAGSTIWYMTAKSTELAVASAQTNWSVRASSFLAPDNIGANANLYGDISAYTAGNLVASNVSLTQYAIYYMPLLSGFTPVDREIYFYVLLDGGTVTANTGNVDFIIQYQG